MAGEVPESVRDVDPGHSQLKAPSRPVHVDTAPETDVHPVLELDLTGIELTLDARSMRCEDRDPGPGQPDWIPVIRLDEVEEQVPVRPGSTQARDLTLHPDLVAKCPVERLLNRVVQLVDSVGALGALSGTHL